ncbi:MAG: hypothetical protein HZB38_08730 [Planctomycetes bacterium]|nr:hypothetical protein [Planctomycetota bacterium]
MPRCLKPTVFGLLLVMLAATAVAQKTRDLAESFPADALAYVGWNDVWPADDSSIRNGLNACLRLINDSRDSEPDIQQFSAVVALAGELFKHPGALCLLGVSKEDDEPEIHLALVCSAGDAAAKLNAGVHALAPDLEGGKYWNQAQIGGVNFDTRPIGDSPLVLHCAAHQGYFLAATSATAAEAIAKRIAGGAAGSLAENAEWKAVQAKLKVQPTPWSFSVYIDTAAVMKKGVELTIATGSNEEKETKTALDALGISAIRSVAMHCSPGPHGQWTRSYIHTGGKATGLLSLWEGGALTDADLAVVPKDAYWASATKLDLYAVWQAIVEALDQFEPEAAVQANAGVAAAKQFVGFSLTDDLLPALGDTWVFYDSPSQAGLFFMGTVMVLHPEKPESLDQLLRRVVQLVGPLVKGVGVTLTVKSTKYHDHTIDYIVVGGMPSPLAISWSNIDGRVVVGLYPQTVASIVDQVDPKTRKSSILDHTSVKAVRKDLPAKVVSWGYTDARYFDTMTYPVLVLVANALRTAAIPTDSSIDLLATPPLADSLSGIECELSVCEKDADGVLYSRHGTSSWIPTSAAPIAFGLSIMLPSLSRARELAKRAVCASNLRGIGMGMHIYANDHDEDFPPKLAQLVKDGMCTEGMFVCPSSSDTEPMVTAVFAGKPGKLGYTYIAGQSAKDDARNVLIYETLKNHANEGASLLFLDGHVEFRKPAEYREAIRETYKRLKRESELPPEFQP